MAYYVDKKKMKRLSIILTVLLGIGVFSLVAMYDYLLFTSNLCEILDHSSLFHALHDAMYVVLCLISLAFALCSILLAKRIEIIYEFRSSKAVKRMKFLAFFSAYGSILRSLYNIFFFTTAAWFYDLRSQANGPNHTWYSQLIYAIIMITYYPGTHLVPLTFLVYNFSVAQNKEKKVRESLLSQSSDYSFGAKFNSTTDQ